MISDISHRTRRRGLSFRTLCAAGLLMAPAATHAADEAPSPNATENLVRLMAKQKLITPEQAEGLISQARAEAEQARAAAKTESPKPGDVPAPNGVTPPKDGVVRVQYVPESVKQQLREDIRQELERQAKEEGWAKPGAVPEWVRRFHPSGDFRLRFDGRYYPEGNNLTGAFPNFNAINTGAPYDVAASNPNFAPQLNADETRERVRVRARLGTDIDLGDDFTSGFRIATGDTASPISQNQTFGQAGGFTKYALWVDRMFLRFRPTMGDDRELMLELGRFDNPFFSSHLLWAEDLGFDGFAAKYTYNKKGKITPFVTAGAFPIGSNALDFSTLQPDKQPSVDKWLYAAQIGAEVKTVKDVTFKIAGAYYQFDNVSGKLSTPFTPLSALDEGDTDNTRPAYANVGNTYMALRNILPDASNGFGTTNQWQYFGLAPEYRVVALTARADISTFDPVHLWVDGEVIKNIAFNRGRISALAVNNRTGGSATGAYDGGDLGWDLNLNFGKPVFEKRWDWAAGVGYRHQESDSTMDAFNDNDFGNGGTNLQGYTLYAAVALSKNVWVRARWFSAENIAGPTFRADTLQLDIGARF